MKGTEEVPMLEFYVESDSKLRHLRQCPLGEHMEGFAGWAPRGLLPAKARSTGPTGAAHLGHWATAIVHPSSLPLFP